MAKRMYVGVPTSCPVIETVSTGTITTDTIATYFLVTNYGDYSNGGFIGSGSVWKTNFTGWDEYDGCGTKLTAFYDMDISFTYDYFTDGNRFTLTVNGTKIVDAANTSSVTTKTYSGTLKSGDVIDFYYDTSDWYGDDTDYCSFYNLSAVVTKPSDTKTETLDKARNVPAAWVGVDNVARRVKRAYVGDANGKARLCFNGGTEIEYFKALDSLAYISSGGAGGTIGNYAVFYGGSCSKYGTGANYHSKDVYDSSLTKVKGAQQQQSISTENGTVVANVGDKLLFVGSTSWAVPYIYDSSLTESRSTMPIDKTYCYRISGGTGVNHAIFAGGNTDGSSVSSNMSKFAFAYDKFLVQTRPADLGVARANLKAGRVDEYLVFAGGATNTSTTPVLSSAVDSYNRSLTRTTLTSLSVARSHLSCASVGKYVIFAGGMSGKSTLSNAVDIYDKSLTRTTTTLSGARYKMITASTNNFALFFGGATSTSTDVSPIYNIDAYDRSLTLTNPTYEYARYNAGATTIGDYVIIAGGVTVANSKWTGTTSVYAYKLF